MTPSCLCALPWTQSRLFTFTWTCVALGAIGVSGCVVCSLHARIHSSSACGRSLSYLFAFTWTYGCIGLAAFQVLKHAYGGRFSHPRIPLFVYFLIQHPIGVPGCVVCSLNARLRSSYACGRSLSYLFAFSWTYGCIGVAAGQVLKNAHTEVDSHTRNMFF